MKSSYKLKPLLSICVAMQLMACGGSTNSAAKAPEQTPAENTAPTHNGDLTLQFSTQDPVQTISLLSGAQDAQNHDLTVVDVMADNNNPAVGIVLSSDSVVVTPAELATLLNPGMAQKIKFSFYLSDGELKVARKLEITIQKPMDDSNIDVVEISAALDTQQYYENSGALARDKFFNMHDSFTKGYEKDVVKRYVDEFRMGQGRQFWSPIDAARQIAGESTYPQTQVAMQQGPSNITHYHANPLTKLTGPQNRTVITSHPKNNLSVGNNPIEGARWAADYFEYYYDDASRPLIYEPMNEPFVHAWEYKAQYNNSDAETRQHMSNWFKEIGQAIDNRPVLKNLNVVGYSAAWPSMELPFDTGEYFAHWQSRQKMFMDTAGDYMDGFSVHLYDGINIIDDSVPDDESEIRRSGSNAQAILDLIETYSHYKWNKVKPHAITEYGNIVDRAPGERAYDEIVSSQTIRSINNILMELLAREDRILTSIPFITGYTTWYWQDTNAGNGHPYVPSMWRPDRNKIQLNSTSNRWEFINPNDENNYLLNINHLFYAFWKDVEGHRISISSPDPDVQTAAYVHQDKAYLIINNLEDEVKNIRLNIQSLANYNFDSIKLERLTVPVDSAATHTSENLSVSEVLQGALDTGNSALTVQLAVGETIKFTLDLDKTFAIDNTLQRKTYYAKEHLQKITANQALVFNIDNVALTGKDPKKSTALLRMGIGRAHSSSKQPVITVNGSAVTVPDDWAGYDQKNRKDGFFGAIDIPIPYALLAENNQISVTFSDTGGKVSSMILEVNNHIDNVVVTDIQVNENQVLKLGETFQASSQVLPEYAPYPSVSWSSSDESVVVVDNEGILSAVNAGSALITATSHNGLSASFTLTVPQADKNLLADLNSGFESGQFSPWGKYWQTADSTLITVSENAANAGTFGLHMQITDDSQHNGIALGKGVPPQIFGENQNRQFKLSFDVKINASEQQILPIKFLMVPRNDSTGKDEWDARIEKSLTLNTDNANAASNPTRWQTIEVIFDEANWDQHLARLELYFVAGSGQIDAFIDNIRIEVI
ncbi:Ig-like domain-containing protein [Catenovulum sediminis]|uniref:Ig-like domain-containing protein n=1 Tax=Catenovulum sediminis TaxID=1740262 RepID=A0ABV1RM31_9ALTE